MIRSDIRELMPEAYPAGPPPGDQLVRTVNGIQEVRYVRLCQSPTTFDAIWVPQITATDLLPALYDAMRAQLESPQVQFKGLDPEFGWAYVTVPFGFRVGNTGPVSVTARVSFGPLFVWATMTARPDAITFDPGEPGGRSVACSADGRCGDRLRLGAAVGVLVHLQALELGRPRRADVRDIDSE